MNSKTLSNTIKALKHVLEAAVAIAGGFLLIWGFSWFAPITWICTCFGLLYGVMSFTTTCKELRRYRRQSAPMRHRDNSRSRTTLLADQERLDELHHINTVLLPFAARTFPQHCKHFIKESIITAFISYGLFHAITYAIEQFC